MTPSPLAAPSNARWMEILLAFLLGSVGMAYASEYQLGERVTKIETRLGYIETSVDRWTYTPRAPSTGLATHDRPDAPAR